MAHDKIPEELLADCHHLGGLGAAEVLLNRNAALPWFILVPRTAETDFLDLPAEQRQAVLEECAAVSGFIKQVLGFDKVNFAGLGNVVPAMHLHVIGRSATDPCWPQPVWGNLSDGEIYTPDQLREWQAVLVDRVGLTAVSLP